MSTDAAPALTKPEPTEDGWYRYSGGNHVMVFLRKGGEWTAHFDSGSCAPCVWGYIEQALGVWDLVPMAEKPMRHRGPFTFDREEDGSLSPESAIFQALGAVSMAWDETPTGVFDSTRAREIGDALVAELFPLLKMSERLLAEIADRESERADLRDRLARAEAELSVALGQVERVRALGQFVLTADDEMVTYEPCPDCMRSGVGLVTAESAAMMDTALGNLRAALAVPEPG